MSKKISFAVIGCGHIGKRHAAMITAHPEGQLIALCDIRPAKDLALDAWEGIPLFSTPEEMLQQHPTVDVVCIATPNGLHEAHALLALKAGKHVVIEKPMALTKAGCERIIFEALHQSRQVFCVMQNRYSPPSVWLRDLVRSETLGKIFMVQVNLYWNRDQRYYKTGGWHGTADLDGGTLFTQFSHFIDIMYWVLGDITDIQAKFADFNHQALTQFEDSGVVTFRLVNGGMGCINFSTAVWDKNLESSITIIGENGAIKVGGQYMNEVEYCHIKDYTMPELAPTNPPNDYGPYKGSAANHHYVFENVIDVLNDRATITTNALEGLKVVEIIERIYQSETNQQRA